MTEGLIVEPAYGINYVEDSNLRIGSGRGCIFQKILLMPRFIALFLRKEESINVLHIAQGIVYLLRGSTIFFT